MLSLESILLAAALSAALAGLSTALRRRGSRIRQRFATAVSRLRLGRRIDRLSALVDGGEAAGELSRGAAARLRRQIEDLRAESFGR